MGVILILFSIFWTVSTIFSSLRDGISLRAGKVGWLPWHVCTWLSRDIPILGFVIIATAIIFIYQLSFWYFGCIAGLLVIHSFHSIFVKYTLRRRENYEGSPYPPEWWEKIRFWKILPWI